MAKRHRAHCTNCDLVFADPLPSPEDWTAYNADYFTSAHGEAHLAPRAVTFRAALGKVRAGFVADKARDQEYQIGKVLEIGPGFGEFAESWCTTHPNAQYSGIETDSSVHARLTGLGLDLLADMQTAAGQDFDLVVASHVLEHTLDPVGFLRGMAACAAPGGMIFVETPCRDDLYKMGDEPHTLFFDKSSMGEAARRADLQDIQLSYHGEPRDRLVTDRGRPRPVRLAGRALRELRLDRHVGLPPTLTQPQRGVIRGFDAHRTLSTPARWIRLMARRDPA